MYATVVEVPGPALDERKSLVADDDAAGGHPAETAVDTEVFAADDADVAGELAAAPDVLAAVGVDCCTVGCFHSHTEHVAAGMAAAADTVVVLAGNHAGGAVGADVAVDREIVGIEVAAENNVEGVLDFQGSLVAEFDVEVDKLVLAVQHPRLVLLAVLVGVALVEMDWH